MRLSQQLAALPVPTNPSGWRRDGIAPRRWFSYLLIVLYKSMLMLVLMQASFDAALVEKAETAKEVKEVVCSTLLQRSRLEPHHQPTPRLHGLTDVQVSSFVSRVLTLPFSLEFAVANGLRAPPAR